MASHSNQSMAHDFFYLGVDLCQAHSYSKVSLSYARREAYSYATLIAKVIPRKGVKPEQISTAQAGSAITLISWDSMSATTAGHINDVAGASPFNVIRVPMNRGDGYYEPRDMKYSFIKRLEFYAKGLNKAENRYKFVSLMDSRAEVIAMAPKEWADALKGKEFKKFETLDITKAAEELKAKNRKEASKTAAETRMLFKKYVKERKGADYLEFIRTLANDYYNSPVYDFKRDERRLLKRKLLNGNLAYCWLEDDNILTSKGVRVPVEDAKLAMRAWALGHDMRKFQVSRYSIVKYEGNEIQIGCHHIPRENMLALYEAVMGKPFPAKLQEKTAV